MSVSISQSIVFPLIWPTSPPARAHARNGYDGKPYHAIRTQNPPICRTGGAAPTKTLPIHKHTVWILLNHLCVLSHTHAAREHRALGKEHSTQRTEPEATNILSRSCEKVSSDKYRARKVASRPLFFVTIRPSAPPFRLPNWRHSNIRRIKIPFARVFCGPLEAAAVRRNGKKQDTDSRTMIREIRLLDFHPAPAFPQRRGLCAKPFTVWLVPPERFSTVFFCIHPTYGVSFPSRISFGQRSEFFFVSFFYPSARYRSSFRIYSRGPFFISHFHPGTTATGPREKSQTETNLLTYRTPFGSLAPAKIHYGVCERDWEGAFFFAIELVGFRIDTASSFLPFFGSLFTVSFYLLFVLLISIGAR